MSTVVQNESLGEDSQSLVNQVLNVPIPRRVGIAAIASMFAGGFLARTIENESTINSLEDKYFALYKASGMFNTQDFKSLMSSEKLDRKELQGVCDDMMILGFAVKEYIHAAELYIETNGKKGILSWIAVHKPPTPSDPLEAMKLELKEIASHLDHVTPNFDWKIAVCLIPDVRSAEPCIGRFQQVAIKSLTLC